MNDTEKEVEKGTTDEVILELVLNDQCNLSKIINEKAISGLRLAWTFLGVMKTLRFSVERGGTVK